MNHKLIMLPQPILVSGEEIKAEPYSLYEDLNHNFHIVGETIRQHNLQCKSVTKNGTVFYEGYKRFSKIIAGIEGLPSLDLSLVEIGWVDAEKLAYEYVKIQGTHEKPEITKHDFIQGFMKAAQSLNEKKYSEEDVKEAIKMAKSLDWQRDSNGDKMFNYSERDIIQSLSKPKEYSVEVEMERVPLNIRLPFPSLIYEMADYANVNTMQPKITNNTIKVTKIIN